jgi:hypothetical protein
MHSHRNVPLVTGKSQYQRPGDRRSDTLVSVVVVVEEEEEEEGR